MYETEAHLQEREEEDERRYERSLLSFCVTEDEYLEVRRGIIPERVRQRYERHMQGGS